MVIKENEKVKVQMALFKKKIYFKYLNCSVENEQRYPFEKKRIELRINVSTCLCMIAGLLFLEI